VQRATAGGAACVRCVSAACAAWLAVGCSPSPPPTPPATTLPPNAFAFGVFGDAPYNSFEVSLYRQLLADVHAAQVQWLIHVGDIFGVPCSDALLAERLAEFQALRAVVYTPGDNEWTDCLRNDSGRYDPLERLAHIRKTFFAQPHQSLGTQPLEIESQSDSSTWAEFVENARWQFGNFLFVTVHLVGSANGARSRGGDTVAQHAEVTRRAQAAVHWIDAAFAKARNDSVRGLVIAMHADPGFDRPGGSWPAYKAFVQRLASHASSFAGSVLLIHGDHHQFRVDHPLTVGEGLDTLPNFTRLETFGSPRIGWVRVVVDSVTGRVLTYEPRIFN